MSILALFQPEGPIAGLAAIGVNLLVASGLIALSLLLGVAVLLLVGLPALVSAPRRVARARFGQQIPE
jgi:Flp pilus assembly protein TadB